MTEQIITQEKSYSMPVWARINLILIAFFIGTGVFQFIGILIAGIPVEDVVNLKDMGVAFDLILSVWGLVWLGILIYVKCERRKS